MLKLISKIEFVLKGLYNNSELPTKNKNTAVILPLLNFFHYFVKQCKSTEQLGGEIALSYWLIDRVCWHLIGYHVFPNVFAARQN